MSDAKAETGDNIPIWERKFTRRDILRGALVLGGAAAGLIPADRAIFPTSTHNPNEEQRNLIAAELKDLEVQKGTETLTFEEVQSLVPKLAKLHASYGSRYSVEELVQRTLIVRGVGYEKEREYRESIGNEYKLQDKDPSGRPLTDNLSSPTIQQLFADYPDLRPGIDITNSEAFHIIKAYFDWALGVNVDPGYNVLFLDIINNPEAVPPYKAPIRLMQFTSTDSAFCEPFTPFANFNTTVLHEFGHLEDYPEKAADPELIASFERVLKKEGFAVEIREKGKQEGFSLMPFTSSFATNNKGESIFTFTHALHEYTIQYLATKTLLENHLSATTYGDSNAPIDTANFERLLQKAGISEKELRTFHKTSNINGFLLRVAYAAEGVSFSSKQKALDFAFELFYQGFEKTSGIQWETHFKPYFPDLDTDFYQSETIPKHRKHPYGCILENVAA